VEAFNPAQQTPALAQLLFGKENRWRKIPVTMYPHSFIAEQSMTNYDISAGVGRTYKYYNGEAALFEYGTGLSYTTFSLTCAKASEAGVAWRGVRSHQYGAARG